MKHSTKIILAAVFLLSLFLSFQTGRYLNEQEYADRRNQCCARLILFAIDKVENHDLSDTGVLEALISNLYAAHEFCDDPATAAQINDLWNTLIYRRDTYLNERAALSKELQTILAALCSQ